MGSYQYKRYLDGVQVGQTSHTGTGWTIGGGAEWMFAPQWSAFLEANYMDLGSRSGTIPTPLSGRLRLQHQSDRDHSPGGVNYRFNWGNSLH